MMNVHRMHSRLRFLKPTMPHTPQSAWTAPLAYSSQVVAFGTSPRVAYAM